MTSPLERLCCHPQLAAALFSRLTNSATTLARLACTSKALAAATAAAWAPLCAATLLGAPPCKASVVAAERACRAAGCSPRPTPWPSAALRFTVHIRDASGGLLAVLSAAPGLAGEAQARAAHAAAGESEGGVVEGEKEEPVAEGNDSGDELLECTPCKAKFPPAACPRPSFLAGDTATLLLQRLGKAPARGAPRVSCLVNNAPLRATNLSMLKADLSWALPLSNASDCGPFDLSYTDMATSLVCGLELCGGEVQGKLVFYKRRVVFDAGEEEDRYGNDGNPPQPLPLKELPLALANVEWF